jgi:hypothetical protein
MPDDQMEQRPDESSAGGLSADDAPTPPDEFDKLVLDENFVRGGSYEPPARTRFAIARFGDQQTSWRHGGGLHTPGKNSAPSAAAGQPAREPRVRKSRNVHGGESRLPIIITAVVVIIAAFLLFR